MLAGSLLLAPGGLPVRIAAAEIFLGAAGDNLVTGFGIGIGGAHKQVFQQPVGGDRGLAQGAELPASVRLDGGRIGLLRFEERED